MTLATEFPDYPAADLPPIPAGFKDTSWHNNSAPSFEHEGLRVSLWIDYADPDLSEWPEERKAGAMKRFSLHLTDEEGAFLADMPQLETDDWSEVLAAILGEAFAAECRDAYSPEEMAEIRRLNATPDYGGETGGPCATHNFADANMIMLAAFEKAFGREPKYLDGTDEAGNWTAEQEADLDVWNAAWTWAKRRHLTAPKATA